MQNGTSPQRVLRLQLGKTFKHIVSSQLIEQATPTLGDPTHGVIIGNYFYYIANSGWDKIDEHGVLKPGAKFTPACIMRFKIR
jgi:hypothetical protein